MVDTPLDSGIRKNAKTLADVRIFEYVLIFMTAFLVSAVVLVLFSAPPYLAFAPAVAVLVILHIWKLRKYDTLKKIESGNPSLKERLKTAFDNRSKDNFIVRELVREVGYDLNNVQTGAFLDVSRTNKCIAVSALAFILLIWLMLSGFGGIDLGALGGSSTIGAGGAGGGAGGSGSGGGGPGSGTGQQEQMQSSPSSGEGSPDNIYGAPSIARIEGEELQLEIHPAYGEGGVMDSDQDMQENPIQSSPFPTEATAAESFSENIPLELEGVVREYFEKTSSD